jgi:4-amino-4-deoxy-L-arabinose transferase-like glycosyltransferase
MSTPQPTMSLKPRGRAVPILIGVLLLARLIGMAGAPLMDTTEARYGEISRKMVELNDWVTPWFDYGVPYWGKPPLAFWVTALSFKLFGVNEFTARLPHLLISILIAGLMVWLAVRRDRRAAMPTLALISGSFLFFISAGAVMTDIELIFGTTLAMAGFWVSLEDAGGSDAKPFDRRLGAALFFGGLILGLLAKGPVALVLCGAPLFVWTAYQHRWLDVWRRVPWILGSVVTAMCTLPWYWIAEQHTPGFLEYFLVGEHWHRFLTPGWEGDLYGHAHDFPVGAIWGFAFIDTLPWSILLPLAAWHWRRVFKSEQASAVAGQAGAIKSDERAWLAYLLVWAIAPMLFFTAARNITLTYVLPGLPAAAVLAGGWIAQQHRSGRNTDRWLSAGLVATLLIACAVAIVYMNQPSKMQFKSVQTMLAVYDQTRTRPVPIAASNAKDGTLTPTDAPLIFIAFRPFSAEFYSNGKAVRVTSEAEGWQRIGAGAAYVATRTGDQFINEEPPNIGGVGGKRKVARLGHYGEFDLLFIAAR